MKKLDGKSNLIKEVTGLILAGGKSSRFGRNKALVEVGGIRLIERVIRVMGSVFQKLIIITNTPDEYAYLKLPMIEDLIKGLGPLGGLYTGLESITTEFGFFVACDMPFLSEPLIRHIIEFKDEFDVILPKIDWKIEALHGLYNKSCLPSIRELIDSRQYQVIRFFPKMRVKYLDEAEIRKYDPELKTFFNINEPREMPSHIGVEKHQ
jgi:molybdopterin-guanine dinucleotide biosynthesis protein A